MRTKLLYLLFSVILFLNTPFVLAEDFLNNSEKEFLVNLARQTLYWYLRDSTIPIVDQTDLTDNLKIKRACFVSLYNKDTGLRGCMGLFSANESLYRSVIDRTIAAVVQDPRFFNNPVTYRELKDIKLEISVLTEPRDLKFNSPQDLLEKLRFLKDGVIITTRYGSSTYLPQVWKELPDKRDFLSNLCNKHGAPPDYWETNWKDMTVQTYEAIVFGEEVYGRNVIGKNGAIVGERGAYLLSAVKPLKKGLCYGGYKVNKGTQLMPGTIVSSDSDIIENR